jgi:hypothetical protein
MAADKICLVGDRLSYCFFLGMVLALSMRAVALGLWRFFVAKVSDCIAKRERTPTGHDAIGKTLWL